LKKSLLIIYLYYCLPPITSFAATGFSGTNIASSSYYSSDRKTLSARLGSTHSEGMYLGWLYESSLDDRNNQQLKHKSFAGSIGLTSEGCYILYHYIFKTRKDENQSMQYRGKGYAFDFGWHFKVTKYISIGPQLSYRKFKYTESVAQGLKQGIGTEESYTIPMLSFGASF